MLQEYQVKIIFDLLENEYQIQLSTCYKNIQVKVLRITLSAYIIFWPSEPPQPTSL